MALPARLHFARPLIVAAALVALAACNSGEPTYEADVVDESGGELIVEDADSTGVPVTLPETPMTNVPPTGDATGDTGAMATAPAE